MSDAEHLLKLRTHQLKLNAENWCKAAEAALEMLPMASASNHPAHDLWLRVQMHRAPPVEIVLSQEDQ